MFIKFNVWEEEHFPHIVLKMTADMKSLNDFLTLNPPTLLGIIGTQ